MWLLSYVGSNFALIAVVVLAVVALGAVAWFARNWKVAVAAVAVLAAGLAYQYIDKTAYQRAVNEQKAREIAIIQKRFDTLAEVAKAYAERASEDAATIDALRNLASDTPANNAPGLPKDSAERVGNIK